ncbi:hypothetical protein PMI17_04021 [Pantoea sp. GM01]|uniref:Uncharacterized protein n=1 Tax=Candidatus Pantoea floridensis TaxID=1938870 RepID=A0A286BVX3_9GAMM|nr:hypothetical protein PMI17_04021 [Pantoea sp. GM01]PIF20783.1 hypothetical protein BX596_0139 [Enterobacteriaceae bacterium JKS000233]SOD38299.1 hypothetical protein SAMN06273570_2698 [Pantoea floridensis]
MVFPVALTLTLSHKWEREPFGQAMYFALKFNFV